MRWGVEGGTRLWTLPEKTIDSLSVYGGSRSRYPIFGKDVDSFTVSLRRLIKCRGVEFHTGTWSSEWTLEQSLRQRVGELRLTLSRKLDGSGSPLTSRVISNTT